jgi:putative flippase GtrA
VRGEAVRFVLVGASSLVVDVATLTALRELAHAPLLVATWCALLVSLAWNYTGQRVLAFDAGTPLRRGLPRYLSLVVLNALVTAGLVEVGDATVGYLAGKAAAVALLTPTNFWAYRAGVFAPPPGRT